jgi:hypothetical protein
LNQLTSYEILIAEKVAQAPVVDLADSIWASIDQQLTADPGGNDQPSSSKPAQPGTGLYFYIIAAAIIIIVSIILYNKSKNNVPQKNNNSLPPVPEQIMPPLNEIVDSGRVSNEQKNKFIFPVKPLRQPDSSFNMPPLLLTPDSVFNLPPPVILDSFTNKKLPVLTVPDSSSSNTNPSPKKPRGVKGLTDDDYKIISGKKDSTKIR